MHRIRIYLLGAFHALIDGESVTEFRSDKARALLVYLALESGRPHRRDALASLLWPDAPDDVARRNLRLTLHRMREALRDLRTPSQFFQISRETIECRAGAIWVDVLAFREEIEAARSHRHIDLATCSVCAQHLARAVALYKGEFLEGFAMKESLPFIEWAVLYRERLHRQVLRALHTLTDYHRARGELEQAEQYARRQIELEPWAENAHRQLMDILARRGRTTDALAQYEKCRRVLKSELNIEPEQATQDLYHRIRRLRVPPPSNLPISSGPFVGREDELTQISLTLANPHCRLLTLVGPPGVGKTRLALEAAAKHRYAFLDGVFFVPLQDVVSSDSLPVNVAQALQAPIPREMPPLEGLVNFLRDREILLILDSFEHLLVGRATPALDFLKRILEATHNLKIVVTSRERLNLRREWVIEVGGLPTTERATRSEEPLSQAEVLSPAVTLFVARARQIAPDFSLHAEAPHVVHICQFLEGLPLGIELAAAWVGHLRCCEIADRLDESLDFLQVEYHDIPPRSRSLQAACDHSWRLLSAEEQRVFRQISVFRGGFTLEAVSEIVGASMSTIVALVSKSLLRKEAGGRYSMHEFLRRFAAAKLEEVPGEAEKLRRRHSQYFARFLSDLSPAITSRRQKDVLNQIQEEIANIETAWDFAVQECDVLTLQSAMDGLYHFYEIRGWYREGKAVFSKAVDRLVGLDAAPISAETRGVAGRLLVRHAWFCWRLGMYALAEDHYRWGVALFREEGDLAEVAFGLGGLGLLLHNTGMYQEAEACYEESLQIFRSLSDPWGTARALSRLGLLMCTKQEWDRAITLFSEALAIAQEVGELRGNAGARAYLGFALGEVGRFTEARNLCAEALAHFREVGDAYGEALCFTYLGSILHRQGEHADALHHFQEALRIFRRLGEQHSIAYTLWRLGQAYQQLGQLREAHRCYEESLATFRAIGSERGAADVLQHMSLLGTIQEQSSTSE